MLIADRLLSTLTIIKLCRGQRGGLGSNSSVELNLTLCSIVGNHNRKAL